MEKAAILFLIAPLLLASAEDDFFKLCVKVPRSIDCSRMNITSLPSDIYIHNAVERLNLQQNAITKITENTFYVADGITTLDISYNKIHFIQDNAFLGFGRLTYLNLASNQLSSLPFHFLEGLENLRILDLSHNYLTLLPGDMFEATPLLQELKLSLNPIVDLGPETFLRLRNLEKLLLDHTHLKTLDINLFKYCENSLQTLNIAHNLFTEVPPLKLPNLKALDLSFNHIQTILPEAFQHCPHLTTLYINNNNALISIKAEAFSKLTSLRTFHCSYNINLKTIDPTAFHTNGSLDQLELEQLHMRGNKLQSLPEELVSWENIFYFDLRENPWRCDCKLLWMKQLNSHQDFQDQLICKSPRRLYGRTLGSISPQEMVCGLYVRWDAAVALVGVLLASCVLAAGFLVWMFFLRRKRVGSRYARIIPMRDRTDLEWDESAEP